MTKIHHLETIRFGVIAGAAGGLAEIAWVTLYAGVTGGNAAVLARGVTTAAGLASLFPPLSAALGIALHMTLAVGLGIALAFAWCAFSAKHSKVTNPFPFMITALAGVWVVNFFMVLPIVSPAFVHLTPYSVSLISKMLFALAAAEVFRQRVSMRQADKVGFARSSS